MARCFRGPFDDASLAEAVKRDEITQGDADAIIEFRDMLRHGGRTRGSAREGHVDAGDSAGMGERAGRDEIDCDRA